jgi:branched-chain amino acid transport system ATP-binding protein
MLEIRDLRVAYGTVTAVDGLTADVGVTECVALLGPNGAGKSSALRAVAGHASYSGSVSFDGHNLRGRPADKIARLGILYVPEGRRLFPTLNVHENLLVGETARFGRRSTCTVGDVYELFPALKAIAKRSGWMLSGGEQQMVAVGRALVGSPRLLLLDEPSLGLAPMLVRDVYRALGEVMASTSLSILLVEQNTGAALRLADRGYVLSAGRLMLSGTSASLADRRAMVESYLGHSGDHGQHATPHVDATA